MQFSADSDSEITRGYCACLTSVLDGATPEEVLELHPEDFAELNVVGSSGKSGTQSRVNTWHNVLIAMQKRAKVAIAEREGRPPVEPFPSLIIGPGGIQAQGSYAEAQVRCMNAEVFL
jgi:quinolinate synthase